MEISNKIKEMCKNIDTPEGKLTDQYQFTLNAVDLKYYKTNIGEVDIKYGFVDGKNDGGIDYIYSDGSIMSLIQGKSSASLSLEDIKNIFRKMHETVDTFENGDYSNYSEKLKSIYINTYDELDENKNIELVLFTNTQITDETRKAIAEFAKKAPYDNYRIRMYDESDLDEMKAIIEQDSDLVQEDSIKIWKNTDNKNDALSYGDNGIIVNVLASSVKRIFEKYSKKGLFSYNLREHISQKSVDDAIDNTIKTDRKNFWYYNNGITIGCEDFDVDGNKVKLYGFSIINGAQTTTKIGKSKIIDEKNDFPLSCKIVRAERSVDEDGDFIGKISEASNSQKPIKQRDLKSNTKEQKLLQSKCANNGKYSLAVEIKRGVKPKNYKKVENWQRITNEQLGQLIYACLYQHSGSARSDKAKLFSSEKVYNSIFKATYDYDTLYDLVRLGNIYDVFLKDYIDNEMDIDKIAIAKNGKLTCLATCIYLWKKQLNIVSDYTDSKLRINNLKGLLVTDYDGDDLEKSANDLFGFIVRFLFNQYTGKKDSLKVTSCSNFFKNDKVYEEVILKEIDSVDDYDREKLDKLMELFSKKKVI